MEATGKVWLEVSSKRAMSMVERLTPWILMILAVIVILPGLGAGSLRDWDEAIYAQVSREIIQSRDWIHLSHGYAPYLEKPPLLMWAIAIFYKSFGVSELAARMPSAISGILLVFVTYLTAKEIYGSRAGLLAGLVLLSSYGFVFQARNGTTNMPLSLFIALGIYGYLRLRNGSQKWWYFIFAAAGLAFMVKMWAGLVLPAVVVVVLLLEGKVSQTMRSRHFWGGVLLAGLIVGPWHLLVYLHDSQGFLYSYITRNLLARTLIPLEEHYGSKMFYWDVTRHLFVPWFVLIPFGLAMSLKEILNRQEKSNILIVVVLLVFGIYSFLVNTKLESYILPAFSALAILTAYLFVPAASAPLSNDFINLISAALVATVIVQNKLLVLAVIIGVGLFVLIKKGTLAGSQISQVISGLIFIVFALVGVIGYLQGNNQLSIWPVYNTLPFSPVARIAMVAGRMNPSKTEPLIAFDMVDVARQPFTRVEGPAAMFYSNRPMEIATSWDELDAEMTERGSGELLIAEKYLDRLPDDFDIVVIEKVDPLVYVKFSR